MSIRNFRRWLALKILGKSALIANVKFIVPEGSYPIFEHGAQVTRMAALKFAPDGPSVLITGCEFEPEHPGRSE